MSPYFEYTPDPPVNPFDKATYELIDRVQKQKDKIITDRLKELGIDLNIEEEKQRRFKRIAFERSETEETVYFNDGSVHGIRVVTFTYENSGFNGINTDINKLSVSLSYY